MAGPRTIRGAKKRGWTVVYVPRSEHRSWVGTCNWIAYNAKGDFIDEYRYVGDGDVAFEKPEDAALAVMFLNANLIDN